MNLWVPTLFKQPQRLLCATVKLNVEFCYRYQDFEMSQLRDIFQWEMQFGVEKNSKERSIEIHKAGKVEQFKLFVIKKRATGFGIFLLNLTHALSRIFFTTLPSFLLKWYCVFFFTIYQKCICFNFESARITIKILALVSDKSMNFELFNC